MYDWEGEIDRIDDPDLLAELLGEVTLNISKNFIPNEMKTFRPGDPPWLTKSWKNAYRKYSRYYKRYAMRGYPAVEKERVDTLKNDYVQIITAEKEIYMQKAWIGGLWPQDWPEKILDSHEKITE